MSVVLMVSHTVMSAVSSLLHVTDHNIFQSVSNSDNTHSWEPHAHLSLTFPSVTCL